MQECPYCGQVFARAQKLRYHLRLHTGEGLLRCELCDKVYTHSYAMKTHLATVHSDERYECAHCNDSNSKKKKKGQTEFGSAKALSKHLHEAHADVGTECAE